jgi:phosphopantothenoylcysteine decarboxylase/phosphopantothenate--cysteine ligase
MPTLNRKRVLLIISGGIAAYKSPDVVRRMREAGAEVRVVMTEAAVRFVTPLTLQAVSGLPVTTDLFDPTAEAAMGHIELARWCDCIVIAPATADFLGRLSHGRADDLATTICLASRAPVLAAPAMNQQMWAHPATIENLDRLKDRGVCFCGPAEGSQACGETGPGRMMESEAIVDAAAGLFMPGVLDGKRVLVTAGPTREAIDPVRYISNHSSGRMGYAVAEAAQEAGAAVTLVSGPVQLAPPAGMTVIQIESATEMLRAVLECVADADIFILAQVAVRDPAPFTVGFAAETEALEEHAREKLARKQLDMIAANVVGPGLGFNTDENALLVLWPKGQQYLEKSPKTRLARDLIRLVAQRHQAVRE